MAARAALLLCLGATLLSACGSDDSRSETDPAAVDAPQLTDAGPRLTRAEWTRSVEAACRRGGRAVGQASRELAREINRGTANLSQEEISRRAFELSRPAVEAQLAELAELRPPAGLDEDYQGFIDALATDLELTGSSADVLASGDVDAEQDLDAGLAAAGAEASAFIDEQGLQGCLLGGPGA